MHKRKLLMAVIPYTFLEYIAKDKTPADVQSLSFYLVPILFVVTGFMALVGIRKMRISTAILCSELVLSGYMRMVEKITTDVNPQEAAFFGLLGPEVRAKARETLLGTDRRIIIATIAFVSCIFGCIIVHVMVLCRLFLSALVAIYAYDQKWDWTIFGDTFGDSYLFKAVFYAAMFLAVFIFSGYLLRLFFAIVFSLNGAFSLAVLWEKLWGTDIGMRYLFRDRPAFFVINAEKPGFMYTSALFLTGMISQLLVLKGR